MANDPVLIAYVVNRRRSGKGANYERIGRAYPHDKGEGLTIIFDAWPLKPGPIFCSSWTKMMIGGSWLKRSDTSVFDD